MEILDNMITVCLTVRTCALALLLAGALSAQAPASEDAIWKQYFAWFQEGDPRSNTPDRYRVELIAEGLSEAQANERLEVIRRLSAQHRSDFVALFFNRIYTDPVASFNTEPNAFLVSTTAALKPGKALDVSHGTGTQCTIPGLQRLAGDRF